ncbi:hypothetical protein Nocox_08860 [Nonomuraea coxensis DSM 45129]|uniref:Uncharacterized protein n=1 Tax=Nonomuraea coxensis DSM 45129 TaxID=1122611 RepID=A0ABX8TVA4_9ACTN|nr:hypothetical protein Nocox_08860 [Nonomuraea coxensis DSM 45129]
MRRARPWRRRGRCRAAERGSGDRECGILLAVDNRAPRACEGLLRRRLRGGWRRGRQACRNGTEATPGWGCARRKTGGGADSGCWAYCMGRRWAGAVGGVRRRGWGSRTRQGAPGAGCTSPRDASGVARGAGGGSTQGGCAGGETAYRSEQRDHGGEAAQLQQARAMADRSMRGLWMRLGEGLSRQRWQCTCMRGAIGGPSCSGAELCRGRALSAGGWRGGRDRADDRGCSRGRARSGTQSHSVVVLAVGEGAVAGMLTGRGRATTGDEPRSKAKTRSKPRTRQKARTRRTSG